MIPVLAGPPSPPPLPVRHCQRLFLAYSQYCIFLASSFFILTVIWKFKPKNRAFIKLLQTTRLFKLSLFCIQFCMKYGSSYFSLITIFGLSWMLYACICYFLFMFRMHWALVISFVLYYMYVSSEGLRFWRCNTAMYEEQDKNEKEGESVGEANGKRNDIYIWRNWRMQNVSG